MIFLMKYLNLSLKKILPREIPEEKGIPGSIASGNYPSLLGFEIDKGHEFRKKYGVEVVIVNGNTRRKQAKLDGVGFVKVRIPETIEDLVSLMKEGEWLSEWGLESNFEDNKDKFVNSKNIKSYLKIWYGVENISTII